jgi:hypothetical protein
VINDCEDNITGFSSITKNNHCTELRLAETIKNETLNALRKIRKNKKTFPKILHYLTSFWDISSTPSSWPYPVSEVLTIIVFVKGVKKKRIKRQREIERAKHLRASWFSHLERPTEGPKVSYFHSICCCCCGKALSCLDTKQAAPSDTLRPTVRTCCGTWFMLKFVCTAVFLKPGKNRRSIRSKSL